MVGWLVAWWVGMLDGWLVMWVHRLVGWVHGLFGGLVVGRLLGGWFGW